VSGEWMSSWMQLNNSASLVKLIWIVSADKGFVDDSQALSLVSWASILREFGCDLEGKLMDLTGIDLMGDKLAIFTYYANAEYHSDSHKWMPWMETMPYVP
jgi:hypothetical protein